MTRRRATTCRRRAADALPVRAPVRARHARRPAGSARRGDRAVAPDGRAGRAPLGVRSTARPSLPRRRRRGGGRRRRARRSRAPPSRRRRSSAPRRPTRGRRRSGGRGRAAPSASISSATSGARGGELAERSGCADHRPRQVGEQGGGDERGRLRQPRGGGRALDHRRRRRLDERGALAGALDQTDQGAGIPVEIPGLAERPSRTASLGEVTPVEGQEVEAVQEVRSAQRQRRAQVELEPTGADRRAEPSHASAGARRRPPVAPAEPRAAPRRRRCRASGRR